MSGFLFYTSEKRIVSYADLGDVPTSGTVYSLVILAHNLSKLGHNVVIACNVEASFQEDGVRYEQCHSAAALITMTKERSFASVVVVGHAIDELTDAIRSVPNCVYWLHNWTPFAELSNHVKRFGFKQVICVSRYHLGYYLTHALRAPLMLGRLSYLNNPVDARFFTARDTAVECRDEIRVAFIGYPSKGKGFDKVMDMMLGLSQLTDKRCVLHVFGDTTLYNNGGTSDVNMGAYEPSVLHGSVSRRELYPLLMECNFAVSGLSGSETFCISLVEAAACGVVPVTVNSGGQVSFLNAKNALIAERVEDLPEKIVSCLVGSEGYTRLVAESKKLYQQFSPNLIAEDLSSLLDLSGKGFTWGRRMRVLLWFLRSRLFRAISTLTRS